VQHFTHTAVCDNYLPGIFLHAYKTKTIVLTLIHKQQSFL